MGAGDSFAAALRAGQHRRGHDDASRRCRACCKSGDARLLVDLRTPQSTEQVLGGRLSRRLPVRDDPLDRRRHRAEVQRLVNALVMALRYIATHSAEEIAAQLPADYIGSATSALFVATLRDSKAMFIADGAMPPSGPDTVLRVMQRVDRSVQGKPIDLSRTYTTEFTAAAP